MMYPSTKNWKVRYLSPAVVGCALLAGCVDSGNSGPTTKPTTVTDRQNAALQDPFGYGKDSEKTDISGGGINTLDKKALKRDLDSFFNP